MLIGASGGTNRIMDTLNYGQAAIIEYGIDLAFQQFADALIPHNEIRNALSADVVETTTKEQRHRFGGSARFTMREVDQEFSQGRLAKKVGAGQTMGLPLKTYAPESLQWTERYFKFATVEEVNAQMNAQLLADVINDRRQIALALFTPTNATFFDANTDGTSLAIKRLANGDGWELPLLPGTGEAPANGGSHTHYTASEALDATALSSIQENVREHYQGGNLKLYINVAQEATIRALSASVFVPLADPRVTKSITVDTLSAGSLDLWSTYNRMIGVLVGGAEVWVKPWVPAGYVFCFNDGATKPLFRRQDKVDPVDLVIVQTELPDNRRGKLTAWSVERTFGYGTVERTNGVCHQITGTGNGTTYTAPSL